MMACHAQSGGEGKGRVRRERGGVGERGRVRRERGGVGEGGLGGRGAG